MAESIGSTATYENQYKLGICYFNPNLRLRGAKGINIDLSMTAVSIAQRSHITGSQRFINMLFRSALLFTASLSELPPRPVCDFNPHPADTCCSYINDPIEMINGARLHVAPETCFRMCVRKYIFPSISGFLLITDLWGYAEQQWQLQ